MPGTTLGIRALTELESFNLVGRVRWGCLGKLLNKQLKYSVPHVVERI